MRRPKSYTFTGTLLASLYLNSVFLNRELHLYNATQDQRLAGEYSESLFVNGRRLVRVEAKMLNDNVEKSLDEMSSPWIWFPGSFLWRSADRFDEDDFEMERNRVIQENRINSIDQEQGDII